jgi:hypothetical protein
VYVCIFVPTVVFSRSGPGQSILTYANSLEGRYCTLGGNQADLVLQWCVHTGRQYPLTLISTGSKAPPTDRTELPGSPTHETMRITSGLPTYLCT